MRQKLELNRESSLETLFAYEETRAVFEECFPGMLAGMENSPMPREFTLRQMAGYGPQIFTEEKVTKCEAMLAELEIYGEVGYEPNQPLIPEAAEVVEEPAHTSIKPGTVMRDTNGRRIQAHGGAVIFDDDAYYWYGENKDRTDGKVKVWTWGIRVYRSTDLYNWEDLGLIIEPELNDIRSGLYPDKHIDRPHIIKCNKTGKFVCWIKQSGDEACFIILQADKITGPYELVQEGYRPYNIQSGDFDMVVDEETEKAYLYMDGNHSTVFGYVLTDDYLQVREEVTRQYENLHPPVCREGVTVFGRGSKKYMITSGMSGYVPNQSDVAISDGWDKSFTSIGDPHVNDESGASFNSQISQVFKVPGKKDLYIAIADRWVPYYHVDKRLAEMIVRFIGNHHDPAKYPIAPEEHAELKDSPLMISANTSISDYIWLPVTFEEDKPQIIWRNEWHIEDFE